MLLSLLLGLSLGFIAGCFTAAWIFGLPSPASSNPSFEHPAPAFDRVRAYLWMSGGASLPGNDDIISLAAQFQGQEITIRGPANQAWNLARRLSSEHSSGTGSTSTRSAGNSSSLDCPPDLLALAAGLSAASVLSPRERIL